MIRCFYLTDGLFIQKKKSRFVQFSVWMKENEFYLVSFCHLLIISEPIGRLSDDDLSSGDIRDFQCRQQISWITDNRYQGRDFLLRSLFTVRSATWDVHTTFLLISINRYMIWTQIHFLKSRSQMTADHTDCSLTCDWSKLLKLQTETRKLLLLKPCPVATDWYADICL